MVEFRSIRKVYDKTIETEPFGSVLLNNTEGIQTLVDYISLYVYNLGSIIKIGFVLFSAAYIAHTHISQRWTLKSRVTPL